jgi:uncharacterized protein
MRYYDTSAVVKRYIEEPGSPDIRYLMQLDRWPITGAATGAEVPAALGLAVRSGRLAQAEGRRALAAFWSDWRSDYAITSLDHELAFRAGEAAWSLGLRGYDAAHLATGVWLAEQAGQALTLVTYDRQMCRAARQLGLSTYPDDLDAFYAGLAG